MTAGLPVIGGYQVVAAFGIFDAFTSRPYRYVIAAQHLDSGDAVAARVGSLSDEEWYSGHHFTRQDGAQNRRAAVARAVEMSGYTDAAAYG